MATYSSGGAHNIRKIERGDTPLLPVEATREALANAFVHRDYSLGGGSVNLALYDDRLEVISIGDKE